MIQHAFTSAYTNQISQQNQGIGTITKGAKDVASLGLGVAGFSGAFGTSELGEIANKASKYNLAVNVGGVGGAIMLATLKEKKDATLDREQQQQMFSREEIGNVMKEKLGDNPINRSAMKSLNTVFDTIMEAKEADFINEKGMIETNIGDIKADSPLGIKLQEAFREQNKKKGE